jgi:nicotinamidase-related amidase
MTEIYSTVDYLNEIFLKKDIQDQNVKYMFIKINELYRNLYHPERRKTLLNVDHILYKVMEMLGYKDELKKYKLLKSVSNLEKYDEILEQVVSIAKIEDDIFPWKFIPTIFHTKLMVIDMQNIFDGRYDKWEIPNFNNVLVPRIREVIDKFSNKKHTILTKFIPKNENSSWNLYFNHYPEALNFTQKDYDLVHFDGCELNVIESHKFSKFSLNKLKYVELVYICGVATGCCIMSTALELIDNGIKVTIIADACFDSSIDDHKKALELLSNYYPMISIIKMIHFLQ